MSLEELVIETEEGIVVEFDEGTRVIEPLQLLNKKLQNSALLILNQEIGIKIDKLWDSTHLHVCADGGANRLYSYFGADSDKREEYIPQFITGDLDSLTQDVREYYESRGTVTIPQYTQYATDFNKAISLSRIYFSELKGIEYKEIEQKNGLADLEEQVKESIDLKVYVLNGIGGRFDQTIHSIHQLYGLNISHPRMEIFFLTNDDVVFLVSKGRSYIKYDKNTLGPICGLLPIGKTITLNTWGLKYDVRNWESDMVSKVSSSNSLHGKDGCLIETSDTFVMNIEWNATFKF